MPLITAVPAVIDQRDPCAPVAAACEGRCPTCGRRCLGGPLRYVAVLHMCAEAHRWGSLSLPR